jgi:uncharacterized protein YciI
MKKLALLLTLLSISITGRAQNENPLYDADLAKELGADDYGMKNYIFVILKTGDAEIDDPAAKKEMFKGHFANISKLAEEGKLVVAGPYGENDREYRGLFILDVNSKEEAMELLNNDPTIANGIFEVELTPWYGSAALPTYLDNHKKIEKLSP